MNKNNEDEMLKKFFGENKTVIVDNGFSEKVMQKIPHEQSKEWIVWVFAIIGIGLASYLSFSSGLVNSLLVSLAGISIYYLLLAVFCFPLITFIVLSFQNNKYVGLGQF